LNKKHAVLEQINVRLTHDGDQELKCGIEEVKKIMVMNEDEIFGRVGTIQTLVP